MIWEVFIPVQPMPWTAPRVGARGGRSTAKFAAFKAEAVMRLKVAWLSGHKPLKGPLKVDMAFIMPNPKYLTCPHDETPDIDNLRKAASDVANKIIWLDDRQIFEGHTVKRYAFPGEPVGILYKIGAVES